MKVKKIIIILLSCVSASLSAQQNPDVDVWYKEYEPRIEKAVKNNLKLKPEFAEDLRRSNPDYVIFVPEVDPNRLGDMYNDHIQVFDKPDAENMLFAVWCQASVEGALDQHIAFSRSHDKGKTWEKPHVLAGYKTIAEGYANSGAIASWAFPMVSHAGRIYIIYNQFVPGKVATSRQHTGLMMCICSDDNGVTWSKPAELPIPRNSYDPLDTTIPPEWVVWQRPLRQGKNGNYLVGVTHMSAPHAHAKRRTATSFIHFDNIDQNPEPKDVAVRWVMTGENALEHKTHCEEPSVAILPDGRLFCIMRAGSGTPVWSVSSDKGETWSNPRELLTRDEGEPIPHPLSPCPMYDWKGNEAASGYYFLLVHNKFNKDNPSPWQTRGPLYMFAGRYHEGADQPVWFDAKPNVFIDRPHHNSFYTSTTTIDGKTVLWYNDQKFYLLGRTITDEWFK